MCIRDRYQRRVRGPLPKGNMSPSRVVLLLACAALAESYSFITLGDWGGAALEEPSKPYSANVKAVAASMAASAAKNDAKFIVNTGDNFYWCGIQNVSDFQVQKDWIDPFYSSKSLQVPWYGVLGNHEYGYNVTAQLDLSSKYENWVMDARYYTKRIQLEGSNYATMIFLDTSPCVTEYRSSSQSGWDPCGGEYPTCSLSGGSDTFEGPCMFHEQILSQDCSAQYTWFQQQIKAAPKDDWLIVVAHHPADDIDEEDFTGVLQSSGFDIYLNGHTHCLTQYTVDNKGAYVTSGAGALVLSHDQLGGTPYKDRTMWKSNEHMLDEMGTVAFGVNESKGNLGHTFQNVFTQKTSGFTLHTFNADFTTLTTDFIDSTGATLHSFTVTKGAGPTPTPPLVPRVTFAALGAGRVIRVHPLVPFTVRSTIVSGLALSALSAKCP
eukprot:TRINITY_DN14007_c0_g4_i1.p1 TRINITY_DN14007_c0_g4~~TRINITY_DN14007_c0_g4_i1.p1  ORF type:complete len:437 (+),score=109.12 TRINITY_DN14007_c0_g4_i1:73-1383(+)